jgi:glutamate 5-kinase
MVTKLVAADLATAAGVTTVITRGATPESILPIIEAQDIQTAPCHTRFLAKTQPLVDRMWWILHGLHTAGTLVVDETLATSMLGEKGADDPFLSLSSFERSEGDESDGTLSSSSSSFSCPHSPPIYDERDDEPPVSKQGASYASVFAHSIRHVEGHFVEHQAVRVVVKRELSDGIVNQVTVAKGLVNFSSAEIMRIMHAQQQNKIDELGYPHHLCIIDKNNMAVSV